MVYLSLRRLPVSFRIISGFLFLVFLFSVAILILIQDHIYIANRLHQVSEVDTRADRFLLLASTRIVSSRVNFLRYYQDYLPSVSFAIEDIRQANDLLEEASGLITLPEQKRSVASVSDMLNSYTNLMQSVQDDFIEGKRYEVDRKVILTNKSGNDITQMIEQIVKNSEESLAKLNQNVQAQTRKRLIVIISSYVLILVFSLFLASFLSGSITRPVSDLRKGAEKFGMGQMEVNLPVEGRDELSLLALTFNKMAKQLQESFAALEQREKEMQQHRNHLEETVKDRTAELLSANEQLEQEIAEHKRTESALRKSERRLKDISYSMADWIWEIDKDGKYTYASGKVKRILGYDPEELIRKTPFDLMPDDEAGRIGRIFKSIISEKRPIIDLENWNLTKDGQSVCLLTNGVPILDDEGELLGYRGVDKDITERKRAEQALRASEEKLGRSKKMESLGLLAGGVAHDLNNVLAGIVSYPELLLLDLPKDSKLRKPIETIQDTGHKAAAIVQDLLTVARGVAIARESLNLNGIVEEYLLSPEFKKLKYYYPKVSVKADLDGELLNISGSLAHIRKVVMNLVSNASEAIEGSGNVIISTRNQYVDRPLRGYEDVTVGEYVVLTVKDDGSGISSDYLDRIFEPFFTKKVMGRSGTGLGLAVVWNIVQDHEGYIDVVSDENGTTFELYFPITRERVISRDFPISIEAYKGHGETILVVDDVENQREISCSMLQALGYKAISVSSGEEAVEYLKEHTVDLLLLDMIMDPGINGRETYERIIKIHPAQKAVIVSGFAKTDEVKEAQRMGAGQYIKKPLTLEKIGIAIRDELKK